MRKSRIVTAMAMVLGLAGSASAASVLSTPSLVQGGANNQNFCIATNVGNVPINVTVRMVGLSGTTEETCTIQPGDPGGCQNSKNELAYCQVLVQGSAKRVRAVMINRSIVSPFTISAAVDAR